AVPGTPKNAAALKASNPRNVQVRACTDLGQISETGATRSASLIPAASVSHASIAENPYGPPTIVIQPASKAPLRESSTQKTATSVIAAQREAICAVITATPIVMAMDAAINPATAAR